MRIAMIGTGYVGLVSGACFAELGHCVTCVDKDVDKVAALRVGVIPIYEPNLESLAARNVAAGRLHFTSDVSAAAADADVVFIAVGTPSRRGDGYADLSFVYGAVENVAPALSPGAVVITKSTVPAGTGDEIEATLRALRPGEAFSVASNPEFLREGAAIEDFMHPDRIVVGANDAHAREVLLRVYDPLVHEGARILFTSRRTSELIKYAANAFLAMKVTFINEMADVCEGVSADVTDLARGVGADKRIGPAFLEAGPGYGGSCLPKDTMALTVTANRTKRRVQLVETVVRVNAERMRAMANKVIDALRGSVEGKRIAILGLTFKAKTDDVRESPAIEIIQALQVEGAQITAYDPKGMTEAARLLGGVTFARSVDEAVRGADAAVIVTAWEEFGTIDLIDLRRALRTPVLVDLRNMFAPRDAEQAGLAYFGVGRGEAFAPEDIALAAPA